MKTRFYIALLIAIVFDLADYVAGWIPIAGDILDIAGIIVLLPLIGKYALLPIIEFIPLGDFLPTFIAAVCLAKSKFKAKEGW